MKGLQGTYLNWSLQPAGCAVGNIWQKGGALLGPVCYRHKCGGEPS